MRNELRDCPEYYHEPRNKRHVRTDSDIGRSGRLFRLHEGVVAEPQSLPAPPEARPRLRDVRLDAPPQARPVERGCGRPNL